MLNTETKNTDLWSKATLLEGRQLRLVPLELKHLDDLEKNLLSKEAWHSVHWGLRTRADLEKVLVRSQAAREENQENGFAMIIKSSGEVVGMSHLKSFNRRHNFLEIGGTWIGERWQKAYVNTEAKVLMLSYVFESIGCQRVEFRVDALNFNSQRAVLRLGAKYEGELRNSTVLPDGRKRDYKVYSIIDSEWPNIKATLNWYLDKYV